MTKWIKIERIGKALSVSSDDGRELLLPPKRTVAGCPNIFRDVEMMLGIVEGMLSIAEMEGK